MAVAVGCALLVRALKAPPTAFPFKSRRLPGHPAVFSEVSVSFRLRSFQRFCAVLELKPWRGLKTKGCRTPAEQRPHALSRHKDWRVRCALRKVAILLFAKVSQAFVCGPARQTREGVSRLCTFSRMVDFMRRQRGTQMLRIRVPTKWGEEFLRLITFSEMFPSTLYALLAFRFQNLGLVLKPGRSCT